ncbi:MAG: hypothetical protein IPP32_02975 [Bacteroidetes bacterium]|nr:hypothetical protein [Bacteroidota bacterium]
MRRLQTNGRKALNKLFAFSANFRFNFFRQISKITAENLLFLCFMEITMFGDFYSSNETTIIGEFENIKELNQSLICDPSELKEQVL